MRNCLIVVLVFFPLWLVAQPKYADEGAHTFIRYATNTLHIDTLSPSMQHFFTKWQTVVTNRSGNLNIVHIGGSHVQAGTLPNTIRLNLLTSYPNLIGSRGMIFPYSAAARCNNPPDYRVRCQQKVQLTRNVHKEYTYPLGICGISITASDIPTEVSVQLNEPNIDYATNYIVLLGHSPNGVVPRVRVGGHEHYPSYIDNLTGRYIFNFTAVIDSFTIVIPCRQLESFTVTGLYLGNRHAGFSYHSIGVNGASVTDYLRCSHFVRDLRMLQPDLVIFGIGINDAVPTNFDTAAFRRNYMQLVDSVRRVNPDCAFIFITNNDSFRKQDRRHYSVNTNGLLAREAFYRIALNCGGAVWDQFEVMGGLRSMDAWRKAGLAQTDRVHFTTAGYQLIGNLFSNALFNAFSHYSKITPSVLYPADVSPTP